MSTYGSSTGLVLVEPLRIDKPEEAEGWFEKLEQSMAVMFAHEGVTGEREREQTDLQKSYLISNIGEFGYEILNTYCAPDTPEDSDKTYAEMKKVMLDNILSAPGVEADGLVISGLRLAPGESLAMFMSRLNARSTKSEYSAGDLYDRMEKDQFSHRVNSESGLEDGSEFAVEEPTEDEPIAGEFNFGALGPIGSAIMESFAFPSKTGRLETPPDSLAEPTQESGFHDDSGFSNGSFTGDGAGSETIPDLVSKYNGIKPVLEFQDPEGHPGEAEENSMQVGEMMQAIRGVGELAVNLLINPSQKDENATRQNDKSPQSSTIELGQQTSEVNDESYAADQARNETKNNQEMPSNDVVNSVQEEEEVELIRGVGSDSINYIVSPNQRDANILFNLYLPKLRFSYRINPTEPSLLSYVDEIFKRPEDLNMDEKTYYRNYFTVTKEDTNYCNSYYLDDSEKFAQDVAAGFNIKAYYGAFCLGGIMSATYSSSSSVRVIRTARYDTYALVEKYIAFTKKEFKEYPEKFLSPAFMKTVEKYSDPEDLEEHLGTFYAWKIKLGGCIKKSIVMEIFDHDKEVAIKEELKAQFGNEILSLNPGSFGISNEFTKRENSNKANIKIEVKVKGGKSELWLAGSQKPALKFNSESARQQWADSFDDTNLYPVAYELKPIWELVKTINPDKGMQFEAYLKKKWKQNVSEIQGAVFLKSKRVFSLKNSNEILKFCKDYAATCEEHQVKAQNQIEIFSFLSTCFTRRYQHWKIAAENGKDVFTQLIADMTDPKTTIKQFRGFVEEKSLHFRIHAEENKGPYWHQLCRDHADKLADVSQMIEEGAEHRDQTEENSRNREYSSSE